MRRGGVITVRIVILLPGLIIAGVGGAYASLTGESVGAFFSVSGFDYGASRSRGEARVTG